MSTDPAEDHRYLCACTAEIRHLTGADPAACRAFVQDFAPLFGHLAARGLAAPTAARAGTVFGWAAMLAGRDGALRTGRTCRVSEAIGRAAAAALLRAPSADARLARLGSRLIDPHSQNMTVAASATADRKVCAHLS